MAEVRRTSVPRPAGVPLGGMPTAEDLPGPGKPPLPSGQVLMTAATRNMLLAAGWQPGDPIPGDLGDYVRTLQRKIAADTDTAGEALAAKAAQSPAKVSLVTFNDLTPEAQKELRQYLADNKEDYQRHLEQLAQSEAGEQFNDLDPGVAAGIQATAAAQQAPVMGIAQPPAGFKVPEGKQYGGVVGNPPPAMPQPPRAAAPAAAAPQVPPQAPAQPPPEAASAGGVTQAPHAECPRCCLPLSVPYTIKPTREDIENFIPAFLGLGVFKKAYRVLENRMTLVFRGLTADETIMINRQLGFEVRSGEIMGEMEYLSSLLGYRMVLALAQIQVVGHTAVTPPTMAEFVAANADRVNQLDRSKETPLRLMRDDFYAKYVTSEHLRKVLGPQHREFITLCEHLEGMVLDPNFSSGIAQRT